MFGISPKFNPWGQDECLVSQGFLSTARCPSPSFSELVSSDRVTGPLGTRASTSVCGGRAVPVLPFVVPRAGFDELVLGWAGLSVAHRGHTAAWQRFSVRLCSCRDTSGLRAGSQGSLGGIWRLCREKKRSGTDSEVLLNSRGSSSSAGRAVAGAC